MSTAPKNINVLLVDDEADFIEVVAKRLRKRVLPVTTRTGGEEALELLAMDPPFPVDVIVLDLKMPGMDGLETLREVKSRCPDVEVIILSGHADVDVAIKGMELGAFDYLLKPMDFDELLFKIEDAFHKRQLAAPQEAQ